MVRKGYTTDQIINKLREVEVFISQGATSSLVVPLKTDAGAGGISGAIMLKAVKWLTSVL